MTTASNFCVALILRTSDFSCGAEPTGLKRTSTFSWSNPPADAKAELASRGRAVRTVDAVIVSGSSGDAGRSWIGEGGGEGEGTGEGTSGYSILKKKVEGKREERMVNTREDGRREKKRWEAGLSFNDSSKI